MACVPCPSETTAISRWESYLHAITAWLTVPHRGIIRAMDGRDFAEIRRYLDKTQVQIARLLLVSPKAVQSFEQGWRSVPAYVERQLLFLLYLKQDSAVERGACWDRKDCPPDVREKCMAWEVQAGRLCWFVNGTECEGTAQKTWGEKMRLCRQCEIFRSSFRSPKSAVPTATGAERTSRTTLA